MGKVIFIRHSNSILNKQLGPSKWSISSEGKEKIALVAQEEEIQSIDVLFSSEELKAIETAKELIQHLKEKIIDGPFKDKRLNEVYRDNGPFFESENEFRFIVKQSFIDKKSSFHTWESSDTAVSRFTECINEIRNNPIYKDKTIGIVSHGTVLNLYFAKMGQYYNLPDKIFEKWSQTPFCGWGIIENKAILRPIC